MKPTTKQPKTAPAGNAAPARKTAVATPAEAAAQPASTEPTEAKPAAPKTPRLSASLKAQADRVIAARDRKQAPVTREARPPKVKDTEPEEDLVVFAFRLSAEERELIHRAAGPAKASRFVRTLVVAAAKRDEAAVRELLATVS
jgi:hypothetical protein